MKKSINKINGDKIIVGRYNGKSNYEMEKILDCYGIYSECMGCLLASAKMGIETDCENCDYYMEQVLRGDSENEI